MTSSVITCDGCGACCMGMNLVPGFDTWVARNRGTSPPRDLPPVLMAALDHIINGPLKGNGDEPCVWLGRATGKCNHYSIRPDICRNMEIGGDDCLRRRKQCGMDTVPELRLAEKP